MTEEPKGEAEGTNADGSPKRDLRYTGHDERNVRVDRELDGSGHLARGDKTHMSVLKFSSRHQSRTDRDPDFEFRPPPVKQPAPIAEASVPPAPVAAEPAASAEAAAAGSAEQTTGESTLVDKIKRIFGF